MKSCLVFLLLLVSSVRIFAQTDTEFWFVAPEVSKNGGQNFDIPIYLRITSFTQAAVVTVSQPANPSFTPIVTTIPANGFGTVDLSPFLETVENKPANSVLNYGLHITSTGPVSIYYEVASTYCSCNPELFTLKGRNAVGTNFLIPTQDFFRNSANYTPTPYNAFDIVATENNTTVTITPTKNIVGHAAGVTFTINLNQGQSWSGLATSQLAADHLWGTAVTSDKPIAITMTDDLLYGITGCADLIGDQIVPVNITGTDYVLVKGNLTNNGNRAFVLATQDNTQLYADGNATPVATLNKAQIYDHNLLNPNSFLSATHPVYVFQTSGFGCELGGALIPAVNCTGSYQVAFTRTTSQQLGVVIATRTPDISNFLLNGNTGYIITSDFTVVPGTGGNWQTANKVFSLAQIPVGTVVFITNTSGPFHLGLMIVDVGGGCSYGYYSDFSRLNLGPDLTVCSGTPVTFDAGPGWTSYLWNTGATTQTISPTTPGTYIVTASDPLCTLSDTVVLHINPTPVPDLGPDVSICSGNWTTLSPAGGPFASYLWSTGETTPTIAVNTTGTYSVQVTAAGGCTGSDNINVTTDLTIPVSVTVSNPTPSVCAGTPVTFTATPQNPGPAPQYQWLVNGIPAGTNSNIFTFTPANNDLVSCILTSSLQCTTNNPATSAQSQVTVLPILPVSVSISNPTPTVCTGTPVTFTATPQNPGPSPQYQWKVNGNNAGTNSDIFTFTPANNDLVSCILTSGYQCTTNNPATSTQSPVTVLPILPVSISISNPTPTVCTGTPVTFTATPQNPGPAPQYQWKVNGNNAGTNSDIFTFTPANNDLVSCILTSGYQCTTNNPATSTQSQVTVHPLPTVSFTKCFDSVTFLNAQAYALKGGLPLGGTYSGPGIISSAFNPNLAGTGVKTVTYTYSDLNTCAASAIRSISVLPVPSFVCGQPFTDPRDGKQYPTVLLGTQCWMKTNLDHGILLNSSQPQTDNCVKEKYCYENDAANCSIYGGLYQWDELMNYASAPGSQGFCMPGWHVPTQAEWLQLFNHYQNQGVAGKPLQEAISTGFNALPGGLFYNSLMWSFRGFAAIFWTSTLSSPERALSHGLNTINYSVSDYSSARSNALPLRCIKD